MTKAYYYIVFRFRPLLLPRPMYPTSHPFQAFPCNKIQYTIESPNSAKC